VNIVVYSIILAVKAEEERSFWSQRLVWDGDIKTGPKKM
jgi:hypothetical protein